MEVTALQALLIGLWVSMVQARCIGYATLTLRFSPLMTGLICGVVMGNVHDAMVITASIQLMYMGVFAPGGAMPQEPCVAAAFAVPTALVSGASAETATVLAVPVGLLGSYMYQLRFFANTYIMKLTDRYAAETADKKLTFSIFFLPTLVTFLFYTPIMYVALRYGTEVISQITKDNAGSRFFLALQAVGGGLAAIGIALTMHVIGKRFYLAFFLLAYFMAVMLKELKIGTVTYAIIGILIAIIFTAAQKPEFVEGGFGDD